MRKASVYSGEAEKTINSTSLPRICVLFNAKRPTRGIEEVVAQRAGQIITSSRSWLSSQTPVRRLFAPLSQVGQPVRDERSR